MVTRRILCKHTNLWAPWYCTTHKTRWRRSRSSKLRIERSLKSFRPFSSGKHLRGNMRRRLQISRQLQSLPRSTCPTDSSLGHIVIWLNQVLNISSHRETFRERSVSSNKMLWQLFTITVWMRANLTTWWWRTECKKCWKIIKLKLTSAI